VFHPADTELSEIMKLVHLEVERVQPRYIVFDGLSELRLLSGDPLRYRRQLLSMKDFFANRHSMVLLLDDRSANFADVQPESLVGGNIVLERFSPAYGRARRRLCVPKVRGSHFRDSLNGYLNAMPEERFLTTHLHELFAYLNQKGILTIIVVAQHGMIVGSGSHGDVDVSYLADTVLLFRYFEAAGEIQQAISVFKKRTGPHERSIRQLTVDASGVRVGEPLREFRGIMTGVPQYRGVVFSAGDSEAPAYSTRPEG
jgi:KaiC/GvpD/RAD55 family RecA-like ATPase